MWKRIIKIALVILIVFAPVSIAAAATFERDVSYSFQIKVTAIGVVSSYANANVLRQIHGTAAGIFSDSLVAVIIVTLLPLTMIIDTIFTRRQSKLRSAPQKSKRTLQKAVASVPQAPKPLYLPTITEQLKLYDSKIDDEKMSDEIKKMVGKISDIDTATGGNKAWANNIENKLKKLFADFFRYLDTYASFDTLSDQTDAIRDTKQKIMEAAGLLYNALDRTYNTLADEIVAGFFADAEALKNILAVKGLLKGTLDMHGQNQPATAEQPNTAVSSTAANNRIPKPIQASGKQSDALPVTEILKTINSYFSKSLSSEFLQILKNIFMRVADIAKAAGSDTAKFEDIENDLEIIFPEFFKLIKNYLYLGMLHDQTENIRKVKDSLIEIARLLEDGLDQIYNDIISRTSMDISADIEAFKGRMSIGGFSDEELDLYKLINDNRLK